MEKHPAFDRHAEMAKRSNGWQLIEIEAPHLPFITHPEALAAVLLDLAAQGLSCLALRTAPDVPH